MDATRVDMGAVTTARQRRDERAIVSDAITVTGPTQPSATPLRDTAGIGASNQEQQCSWSARSDDSQGQGNQRFEQHGLASEFTADSGYPQEAFEFMKKTIRTIIGALLMAFGLVIAVLSMWLFPQPFDLGGFLFSFLPPMLIGLRS